MSNPIGFLGYLKSIFFSIFLLLELYFLYFIITSIAYRVKKDDYYYDEISFKTFFQSALKAFLGLFIPFSIAIAINTIFIANTLALYGSHRGFYVSYFSRDMPYFTGVTVTRYLKLMVFIITPYVVGKAIPRHNGEERRSINNLFLVTLAIVGSLWCLISDVIFISFRQELLYFNLAAGNLLFYLPAVASIHGFLRNLKGYRG